MSGKPAALFLTVCKYVYDSRVHEFNALRHLVGFIPLKVSKEKAVTNTMYYIIYAHILFFKVNSGELRMFERQG